MSLRTASSTIAVSVVEALLSSEPRDGLNQQIDGERLCKHGGGSEPIGLLQRRFVRRAHDDRRCRITLADSTYRSAGAPALVWTKADEIHDHQVGSHVCRRAIQSVDEREVIALIAQNLAHEGTNVAVVFDHQDLSYARQAADF